MPPPADANERLVCAILAAQAAEVRDRIDSGEAVDVFWRSSDLLAQMSGLLVELLGRLPAADGELGERCAAAVSAGAEVGRSLDDLAFAQAQRQDFSRQMAECVVTALDRLAEADVPAEARLSLADLAALYVCEDQRRVHAAAARQFEIAELWGLPTHGANSALRAGRAG